MKVQENLNDIIGEIESSKENYIVCQKMRIYKTIEYVREYGLFDKGMKILNVGGEVEGLFGRLWKNSFPEVEFIPTNTDLHLDLPYADNEFDGILCCEVFEHIGDWKFRSSATNFYGVFHLLNEMTRIMKCGAKLILTTPNVTSINNLRYILCGSHPFMYPLHYREYSRHELEKIVSYIGVKVILLESNNVFMKNKKIINYLMGYLAEHNLPTNDRGDDWFLIYEKPEEWQPINIVDLKTALVVYPEMKRETISEFKVIECPENKK